MVIPTYVEGYPPDGSFLGNTKSTIRNNLDGTFETLGIDHVNNNGEPGSQPPGYHTVIHQVVQTSVSTLTGYNQVFSGVPGTLVVNGTTTPAIPANSDEQLYSLTGGGILSQLTGSSTTTNGYAWVGGILLQWGLTTSSSSNIAVTFPVAYPNNVFNIQATATRASGSYTTDHSITPSPSTTGFTINNTNSSTTVLAYYWMAIGN